MKPGVVLTMAVLAAGCGSRPIRGEEGPRKAVVLCAPEQKEEAESIARHLNESGNFDVLLKVTTLRREHSSLAVYDIHNHPERAEEAAGIVHDVAGGDRIEVLPFQQHATGGNVLVLWLGSDFMAPEAK